MLPYKLYASVNLVSYNSCKRKCHNKLEHGYHRWNVNVAMKITIVMISPTGM